VAHSGGKVGYYMGMSHSSVTGSQSGYYDFLMTGGVVGGCPRGRDGLI